MAVIGIGVLSIAVTLAVFASAVHAASPTTSTTTGSVADSDQGATCTRVGDNQQGECDTQVGNQTGPDPSGALSESESQ
jgi:hypothetical protein